MKYVHKKKQDQFFIKPPLFIEETNMKVCIMFQRQPHNCGKLECIK